MAFPGRLTPHIHRVDRPFGVLYTFQPARLICRPAARHIFPLPRY